MALKWRTTNMKEYINQAKTLVMENKWVALAVVGVVVGLLVFVG